MCIVHRENKLLLLQILIIIIIIIIIIIMCSLNDSANRWVNF